MILFDDYTAVVSKAKYEAKHWKWLKIFKKFLNKCLKYYQ